MLFLRPGGAQGNIGLPIDQTEVSRVGDELQLEQGMGFEQTRKGRHQYTVQQHRYCRYADPASGLGGSPSGSILDLANINFNALGVLNGNLTSLGGQQD